MKKLVAVYSINTLERMSEIINEMKKLQEEFETIINTNNLESYENISDEDEDDLDSYENISDEDEDDLLDDEYKVWVEANFDEDDENDDDDDDEEIEEPEIYNIYFSIENFETLMDYLGDEIPFGYVFDSTENEYVVRMDEDMVDEIKELLEKWAYIEKYERLCSAAYYRIVRVQNALYYNTHYNF